MLYPLGNRLSGDSGYIKPVLSASPRLSVQKRKDEVHFSASPRSSHNRPKPKWPEWLESLKGCWRGKPEAVEVEAEVGGRPLYEAEKPLHAQMSQELERISDTWYKKICSQDHQVGYSYNGERPNYYIGLHPPGRAKYSANPNLDLQKILLMMQERQKGEIQLLDIGCGVGEFIKTSNKLGHVKAYGVTAKGFKLPDGFPKKQYIFGDAQNLLRLMSNKLSLMPGRQGVFDVIVSQMALRYLLDPLGTLTQAYELLKPGGLLIVDRINATGVNEHISQINQYLEKRGFQGHFFQEPETSSRFFFHPPIGPIIIQKSAHLPILDLPVRYGEIQKECQSYQLDTEKLEAAGVTPHTPTEPRDELERFHDVRQKIGIPDECLHYYENSDSQSR